MFHRGEIKPFSCEAETKIMRCIVTIKLSLRFAAIQMKPRICNRLLKLLSIWDDALTESFKFVKHVLEVSGVL